MKNLTLTIVLLTAFILIGMQPIVHAQSSPVMYFCERYDQDQGEIGISDRFTKGYLTVMVKADKPLGLKNVYIEFDKYNFYSHKFDFYKKFNYTIDPDMKYVYFSKNEDSDLKFEEAGFYRVFLLNDANETIASALIEITDSN